MNKTFPGCFIKKLIPCILSIILSNYSSATAQKIKVEVEKPSLLSYDINSEAEEILPLVSPSNNTLYFVRSFHPDNMGGEKAGQDIWLITKDPDNIWSKPFNVGKPLNTKGNNAVIGISEDGNTLYLQNLYVNDNKIHCGLAVSSRTETGWTIPEAMDVPGLEVVEGFYGFHMSPNEKILMVSFQGPKTLGEEDLYVCLKRNNFWTAPIHLGSKINTAGFEMSPFLSHDGHVLYFSSDAHKGFGDADVFVSLRLDDTWQNWSSPVNLGSTVNSDGFDAYFSVGLNNNVFFASNKNTELCDLYVSRIVSSNIDDQVKLALVEQVFDENKPEEKKSVKEVTKSLSQIDSAVKKTTAIIAQEEAVAKEAMKAQVKQVNKDVPPTELLYFSFNSYTLRAEEFLTLDKVIETLVTKPDLKIDINGHADNVGTPQVNQAYSEKRAEGAKQYFLSKGIAATRINTQGFGDKNPVSDNTTPEGRMRNRRVEIIFKF